MVQAVTAETRTARDLGAVAATRLRRMALAARRAAAIRTDDDGHRQRALQADLARERDRSMQSSADTRAALRRRLNALRRPARPEPPAAMVPEPTASPENGPQTAPETDPLAALDTADFQLLLQAQTNAARGTPPLHPDDQIGRTATDPLRRKGSGWGPGLRNIGTRSRAKGFLPARTFWGHAS